VGVNQGRFDPLYTVDTMIDYDLSTLVRFIHKRSCGKPSILIGHSMGGLVAENMVLNWALARRLAGDRRSRTRSRKNCWGRCCRLPTAADGLPEDGARDCLSWDHPNFFIKNPTSFFPTSLVVESPLQGLSLPAGSGQGNLQESLTELPVLKQVTRLIANHNVGDLNFLISPENHKDDKYFVERYLKTATESIPLGLGFQCLKAIYNGKGFKRMDGSRLELLQLPALVSGRHSRISFLGHP
jgi:hypothetical protein